MPRKTLLQISQDAVNGVKDVAIPSTIINNSDPTAILLKSIATKVARELERGYNWQTLKREHTFTTDGIASAYVLPTDFRRFVPLTAWDRTGERPLIGASNSGWQGLQSGAMVSGVFYYFTVYGDRFRINPLPPSGLTMVFDYFSSQFIETSASDSTALDDWTADSNICRLDGDLMTLGVAYRYLNRQGAPFQEEKGDYMQAIKDLQFDDTPPPLVDFAPETPFKPPVNIPDGNWDI